MFFTEHSVYAIARLSFRHTDGSDSVITVFL